MACRNQVVETDEVTWTGVAFLHSLADESEWLFILLSCDVRYTVYVLPGPAYYCYLTLRDHWLRQPSGYRIRGTLNSSFIYPSHQDSLLYT
jgi:hypothetical protein